MMSKLEEAGEQMISAGTCGNWLGNADPEIRAVAGTVNGPLFKSLLQAAGYEDCACVDLLRDGAPALYIRAAVFPCLCAHRGSNVWGTSEEWHRQAHRV